MAQLFILVLMGMLAYPTAATQLALSDGRMKHSLAGSWHYILDPQNVGAVNHSGGRRVNGFFKDLGPNHSEQLQEYDFNHAPILQIPGSWNAQVESLRHYQGGVWLQRKFDIAKTPKSRRYFLQFQGVNYRTVVYLNGEQVGTHEGGFTPFSFEVGHILYEGENSLVVHVDNTSSVETLPGQRYDWWNYGGITREVFLLETPVTFIRNFRLQLDPDDPQEARGWAQLDGSADWLEVRIGAGEWRRFDVGNDHQVTLSLPAPEKLWQPGAPVLHRVELRTANDTLSEKIGFRTVKTQGRDILVNGEKVFLRGISLHDEKLDGSDRMATHEDALKILGAVVDLGANYARLTHYPHTRHMAQAADQLGLLLWAEIPVYWDVDFGNPRILDEAKRRLSGLIERDGNRASIIIWSVGNETPPGEVRNEFLRSLMRHARAADPDRLVSAAAIPTREALKRYAALLDDHLKGIDDNQIYEVEIDDPLADELDIIAYNEYMGWYDGPLVAPLLGVAERDVREASLAVIPRIRLRAAAEKPLILSEFGAGALRGARGENLDLWTEEFQAQVYRAQLAMVSNSPAIAGISPWVLKDFRSPRRPLTGIQDYYNRKGLMDESGKPKLAFRVLADFYKSEYRQ